MNAPLRRRPFLHHALDRRASNSMLRPSLRQYEGTARDIVKAYLGYTPLQYIFDTQVPFPITDEKRFEHMQICAGTGHGKSQTLQHIIMHDLMRPDPPSLVVIDSQGDMLWKIQHLKILPLHDKRSHRSQEKKRPFTEAELLELGMKKVA